MSIRGPRRSVRSEHRAPPRLSETARSPEGSKVSGMHPAEPHRHDFQQETQRSLYCIDLTYPLFLISKREWSHVIARNLVSHLKPGQRLSGK